MRDNKWWEKSTFKFCKFPKVFLTHPKYRALSHGAMVVYAALIDRMSLSEHNGWVDKEGSIFIRYANKELCRTLNCSHETATKKLKELEKFDLLKRKKQGQGKSDLLYVLEPEELCENVALQNAKTLHHRMQGSSIAEGKELASNKTENNNTAFSNTYLSIRGYNEDEVRKIIKENIDYEILSKRYPNRGELDGIVALMTDVCCGTSATISIKGNDYPREMIVERFLNFNMHHIEYVMETLSHTTTDIRNIHAYLLATLFNAPTTMGAYWQQRVRHDMPQLATG
jgi:hypothetical protein